MSFIQRELDRIAQALLEGPDTEDHDRLYSAQQALAWATDPDAYASPMVEIRGILAETEGCSAAHRPNGS